MFAKLSLLSLNTRMTSERLSVHGTVKDYKKNPYTLIKMIYLH